MISAVTHKALTRHTFTHGRAAAWRATLEVSPSASRTTLETLLGSHAGATSHPLTSSHAGAWLILFIPKLKETEL